MTKSDKKSKKNKKAAGNPQGIASRGNALYTIAILALVVALLPAAVGFSYLVTLREPAMERAQIQRVAQAAAMQQATSVQQMFLRLAARLQGAAQSPLALSAIASQTENDLQVVESAMLDYFPEATSLRLIPIGEMGTADMGEDNQGLRNHIEVDLVRRTSIGEEARPESYRFENGWITSMAYLVSHPRITNRRAVIIATVDNSLIAEQLQLIDTGMGRFALQQSYTSATGADKLDDVAVAGSGNGDEYTAVAVIPQSRWQVAFTPSQALLSELAVAPLPLLGVLGLTVLGTLASLALVVRLYPRRLEQEVEKVISAADKKTSLELKVPELVSIAKQLRRATLRNLRQSSGPVSAETLVESAHTETSELTNPLFQKASIIDDDEEEVLELDLPVEDGGSTAASDGGLPAHIFRAYDIRGVAKTELNDEVIAAIGGAIGALAQQKGEQTVIVGGDGRTSTSRIKAALVRALMESGRDVIDIGTVPTPLLYFATRHLNCKSGVMVTGSHNPAEYNGLKIVLDHQTIAAGGIQELRELAQAGASASGSGRVIREDIIPAYIDEVVGDVAVAVPMKVVLDAGNGATAPVAPELFEELGCEVVPLYCELDGRFPNHPPDTSNEDNLADLVAKVTEEGADFGVAFDGDGDRLAVVTAGGQIIRSDVLMMIYAQDVVSRNPGADVVFDVKCSRNLSQVITRHGGRPVLWKTGHAFMKHKMAETGALLGGEFSGHIFFGERWYGFDDGMYAAARLAEILSTGGENLDQLLQQFPTTVNTPEILVPVQEQDKFAIMDNIIKNADFSSGKVNTLDGIRVDFEDGWGLLRASNTTAALTARFEASTTEALEAIMQEFRAQVGLVNPDLELPF